MPDFLQHMAELSADRCARARAGTPEGRLRDRIAAMAPPRMPSVESFLLIAEIKRASPSVGSLEHAPTDIASRARDYARGGAGVISVLTEPARFKGSIDDLSVAAAQHVPVMRKDFLIDPYQLLEARSAGASGVLLIAGILPGAALEDMTNAALELGLFVLVECFDHAELQRCECLRPLRGRGLVLLGANTRDLRDLSVRPDRLCELAGGFPPGFPRIAESGMESPGDVGRAAELGYNGALVGSALMRAVDPAALCHEMLAAAERAAAGRCE